MPELAVYEPPRLEPLTFTAVSKHLAADIQGEVASGGAYDAATLLKAYGSPLYVVREDVLRRDYRAFAAAFLAPEIDTRVAYSYKTNYLPAICSILHEEGAMAEIVSGMEYELARALGVPPGEIVFNGPFKTKEELERALGEGALVNVDNFGELDAVERVASGLARPCQIGIRVNFRYGAAPWTKFGFNNANGECHAALSRIARHPQLELEALHNHSGTFLLVHEVYRKAAEVLVAIARMAREMGLEPTTADLGGGFPSANRLKPEYDLPGGSNRASDYLHPYGENIIGELRRAKDLFGGRPRLILEPGRAVVDASTELLATVVAAKDIVGRGKALVADAGVNLVPTACWYDHGIGPTEQGMNGSGGALEPVNVYGPLCMQIDVLRERALLPPLKIGDPIVIANVGAYCHTQSMQFIQPRPATVLLGPDGPEVIRRRETWRDIFALDSIPPRITPDGCDL